MKLDSSKFGRNFVTPPLVGSSHEGLDRENIIYKLSSSGLVRIVEKKMHCAAEIFARSKVNTSALISVQRHGNRQPATVT